MAKQIVKIAAVFLLAWIIGVLCLSFYLRKSVPLFWEFESGRSSPVTPLKDSCGTRMYIDRDRNIVAIVLTPGPKSDVRLGETSKQKVVFKVDNRMFTIIGNDNTLVVVSNGNQGSFPLRPGQGADWHRELFPEYGSTQPPSQESILSDTLKRCDDPLKEQVTAFIEETKK